MGAALEVRWPPGAAPFLLCDTLHVMKSAPQWGLLIGVLMVLCLNLGWEIEKRETGWALLCCIGALCLGYAIYKLGRSR